MNTFYVYKLVNIKDGSFYYGSRKTNKDPYGDLGKSYFTSSNVVKSIGFENFLYGVVAIHEDFESCYWHEQSLIRDTINMAGSLNRSFYIENDRKRVFSMSGKKQTPEHIMKRTKARIGKPLPRNKEWQDKITEALRGKKRGPLSEYTRKKISDSKTGHKDSLETRDKKSKAHIGSSKPWANGVPQNKIADANMKRAETRAKKSPEQILDNNAKISVSLKGKPKNYKTACSTKFICRLSDKKEFSKASASKYMKDLAKFF